ncbi:MAG: WYL domain-containing protein [Oscillospiraceae bacterium]|nr:WYL domain-containing protein [Oscillospiraceae bacterium]
MAYSELIKSFSRIRDYMRQFYVYGFKSREEYDAKSARSYDNERRRIESWLGEYMSFHQSRDGKHVFLSVDSRRIPSDPLYKAFHAKSFTDKDVTLHFYILDALAEGESLTAGQITDRLEAYLSHFETPFPMDESTVRKKLKEYEALGLLQSEKQGKSLYYRRSTDAVKLESWADALAFFSEAAPLGVIGSYFKERSDHFRFKHHYILHALDSEILLKLLDAISQHRVVELLIRSSRGKDDRVRTICPLKIYCSTQTGRQYILGYSYIGRHPVFYRLDTIKTVTLGSEEKQYDKYMGFWEKFDQNLWGVSTGAEHNIDHIEMTIRFGPGEGFILQRLNREKRHGTVEIIDEHTCRFSADVYDASEMLPWLRTFIGRIEKLECSNRNVAKVFYDDLKRMYEMYGGDDDAVS